MKEGVVERGKPVNQINKTLFSDCFTAVTNKHTLWRCATKPDNGAAATKYTSNMYYGSKVKRK